MSRQGRPKLEMNDPAASSGVSSSLLGRHSVLDSACPVLDTGESSRVFWIPAFAGMTNSRQAAGNASEGNSKYECSNVDGLVRSPKSPFSVIPAKAGIQFINRLRKHLDSGDPVPVKAGNRSDDFLRTHQTCPRL